MSKQRRVYQVVERELERRSHEGDDESRYYYGIRGTVVDVDDPSLDDDEIVWSRFGVYDCTRPSRVFVVEKTVVDGRTIIRALYHYPCAEFEFMFLSRQDYLTCTDITDAISSMRVQRR